MAQRRIVAGPSKFDLMTSLMSGGIVTREDVTFQLEPGFESGNKLKIVINSLEREDGTGDRWCFTAFVPGNDPNTPRNVKGYFDISTRKGWMEEVVGKLLTAS